MVAAHRREIFWVVTCSVEPGRFVEFKQVVAPLVAATKEEPGSLAYEYHVDTNEHTIHICERYRDSDAIVAHVNKTFGQFAERFMALVKVTSFVVYGDPSPEARNAIAAFDPIYMRPFDGFTRQETRSFKPAR